MNKAFKKSYVHALVMFTVFWLINGVLCLLQETKVLGWFYSDTYSLYEIPGATIIGIFSMGLIAVVVVIMVASLIYAVLNAGLILGGLGWLFCMILLALLFFKIDFILDALVDSELAVSMIWILLTHAYFLFVAFNKDDEEESSETCSAEMA